VQDQSAIKPTDRKVALQVVAKAFFLFSIFRNIFRNILRNTLRNTLRNIPINILINILINKDY